MGRRGDRRGRGHRVPAPGPHALRHYERSWLRHDVVAGVVLAAVLVPQGMAYATLAGLPPVVGIYATLVPLLVYAVLGPSRILVLAPDSAIAPVVAATIVPLAGADMDARMELAATLAVITGAFCVVGALLRLGLLTDLLSRPIRLGYLAGVVAVVLADQVPALFGIDVGLGNIGHHLQDAGRHLDQADALTGVVGVGTLALILGLRRLDDRIPAVLVAVVCVTALVALAGLADDLETVGPLPEGLPSFDLPVPAGEDLGRLLLAGAALALLAFADTGVLSRTYATRLGDRVDQDRELVALGGANLATGLFQGFPISSSSSRTPVAEAAGARTQLTGVFAAIGLAVVLVAAPGLLQDLPESALAAVIVASVLPLVDLGGLARLARIDRRDFALALAAFVGVAVLGVLPGVGVAVGLSLLVVLIRAWRPYSAVLGRVAGRKGYHDVRRHPDAHLVPGLVLVRFDAPLFFANADVFRDRVERAVEEASPGVRTVVIAAEPLTDVDTTAGDVLVELHAALAARGVALWIAELKGPVKDELERYGVLDVLGRERLYPTVGRAVRAHVEEHQVAWRDPEDDLES